MMFLGGRDGFKTQLQETGAAKVSYTSSDDLAVVVDAVRTEVKSLGVDVRILPAADQTLLVVPR